MSPDDHSSFEALLRPVASEFFFEEVYERRPLLISRKDPTYYSQICDIDDFDSLLQSSATGTKFLRLHQKGHEISPAKWSRGEEIDADAVSTFFANGATIIINGANRFFPRLASFCNNVERQMRFAVQPNIYITPAGTRGFDRHYDDHDVFIMQIFGVKNWRLYGSPVELPSRTQKHEWGKYDSWPAKETFTLEPGDMLYIPRGHLHDADTTAEAAMHITFGLHPPYLFELVEELARNAQEYASFRRSIPGVLSRMSLADFERKVKNQLHRLVDEVEVSKLQKAIDSRFVSWRNPGRQVSFRDVLKLRHVDQSTRVVSACIVYSLERENGNVQLTLPHTKLTFPSFLEETLRDLLECDGRRISELPGLLDPDGRIALVKQLVAAGVVRLWRENQSDNGG
jgi:ribosomal protein L16 Arg81 hydroxylase